MTLKYKPVSKRVHFAKGGDTLYSREDIKNHTSKVSMDSDSPEYVEIDPNSYYFDNEGYAVDKVTGQRRTLAAVPGVTVTAKRIYPLFDPRRVAQLNRELNELDRLKWARSFESGVTASNILNALYYGLRMNSRNENPEDIKYNYGIADLPLDFNRKGMAKAIFLKAIDSGKDLKQVFSSMPVAALREILEDPNLSRLLSTLIKGGQRQSLGERVFYGSGPIITGEGKVKKGNPYSLDISDATIVDDIAELSAANRAKNIVEEVNKKAPKARKPRLTKTLKEAAALLQSAEAALNAFNTQYNNATTRYRALNDDEVTNLYRKLASEGNAESAEFKAILDEGKSRGLIDENGRIPNKPSTPLQTTNTTSGGNAPETPLSSSTTEELPKTRWQKAADRAKKILKSVKPGKKTAVAGAVAAGGGVDYGRVYLQDKYDPKGEHHMLGVWPFVLGADLISNLSPEGVKLRKKEKLDEENARMEIYNERLDNSSNSTTTTSEGDTVIVSKDLKKIDLGVEDFDPLELEELIKLSISTAK